jgi:putative transposase
MGSDSINLTKSTHKITSLIFTSFNNTQMARLTCFVIPGQPQHASPLHGRGRFAGSRTSSCARQFPAQLQRGNNRQTIFAAEVDYQFFRDALVEAAGRFGLAIHGVVWMTNHIHLLASPLYADSIGKTLQSVGRP